MKKEYQYLIGGALISAVVLLGMGTVGEEKQTSEQRFRFIQFNETSYLELNGRNTEDVFSVMDLETGTVNFVTRDSETFVFPFAATKAEQSNGS